MVLLELLEWLKVLRLLELLGSRWRRLVALLKNQRSRGLGVVRGQRLPRFRECGGFLEFLGGSLATCLDLSDPGLSIRDRHLQRPGSGTGI
jgi:hypothetical protein